MRLVARVKSWFRISSRRADFEREMQDEMRAHLDLYQADLRRRGLSEEDARRRALAEFGSVAARQEECREAVGLRLLDELRGDVGYAVRLLRRSPGFTVVALLSLSLGIGANTAIFSLIDTLLIKTLPVQDPQRLFFVDNSGGKSGGSSGPPYPCFERLRDHNRFLSGIAAFAERPFKVSIDGVPERVRGQYASGSYFELLGVRATHGRLLTPADDAEPGRGGPDGPVAVISDAFWTRRFARDPSVLGKHIQVGAQWVTIVGVIPPGFLGLQVGRPLDVTIPMMLVEQGLQSQQSWWLSVIARVGPGATVEQARADLEALWDSYLTEVGMPREKRGYFSGVALVPAARGGNELRRAYSEPLLIVMGIVGVVLLIGCANVANLLLARATARQNEIAIRLAIGASRGRLIRQLLTEGIVLVSLGAGAGVLFAWWGASFLVAVLAGPAETMVLEPHFDLRVLSFTAGVSLATALIFSLVPALRATHVDAAKPGSVVRSTPQNHLGRALVVIQVTLSVLLLCGAALFVRTLHNLNRVTFGFDHDGILTLQVEATVPGRTPPKTPAEFRADHARLGAIWRGFMARVQQVPGLTFAAATAGMSPLSGSIRGVRIAIDGPAPGAEKGRGIRLAHVTDRYFETTGIRLLSGRSFTGRDQSGSLRVAILNETAARAMFGTESPLGRKVSFPGQRVPDPFEIVGIVGDARYQDLRTPDEPMVYVPLEQAIDPITSAVLLVRGAGDVTRLVPSIRASVAETIPGGFVAGIATIEQQVEMTLVRERMLAFLATFFAVLALLLACIGVYGVMAYRLVQRTREIGIRIAVGAGQHRVVWMMVRETLLLVAIGAALGTMVSLGVNRFVAAQLFGVTPHDPAAIVVTLSVLGCVTLIAGYMPARRASRIDPVKALRAE
jgi:putative ABC transport system permease protein